MFEMNLAYEPMQDRLARAVSGARVRPLVHAANASQFTADSHKHRPRTLTQERERRLEEVQRTKAVHLNVLADCGDRDLSHRRVVCVDTCIGDENVNMVDAMGQDLVDGCSHVWLGFGVDLDWDDFGILARGKGFQSFGGVASKVADPGDDGRVRAGDERRRHALADS